MSLVILTIGLEMGDVAGGQGRRHDPYLSERQIRSIRWAPGMFTGGGNALRVR